MKTFSAVIVQSIFLSSVFVLEDVGAALISSSLLDDHLNVIDSYAENLRPRCSPWINKGIAHFLAEDTSLVTASWSTSAQITVSPTFLDEAGWVEVYWKGLPRVEPLTFWIGVFLEGENATETAPIKQALLLSCVRLPSSNSHSFQISIRWTSGPRERQILADQHARRLRHLNPPRPYRAPGLTAHAPHTFVIPIMPPKHVHTVRTPQPPATH